MGALALEFPGIQNTSSHGMVMGVRGKWLRTNNKILERLGMSKKGTMQVVEEDASLEERWLRSASRIKGRRVSYARIGWKQQGVV